MTINWQEIFTTVGSTAVIVGAGTFLTKSLINQFLTRDVEKFKARLQADAAMEIEKLKNSLQMVTVEHQVRFSKLHEKRAEIIADLYVRLVRAERDAIDIVGAVSWDYDKRQVEFEAIHQKLVDLIVFVAQNRIYLPEPVCERLQNFFVTAKLNVMQMSAWAPPVERSPDPTRYEEEIQGFREIFLAGQAEIPAARKALESEFRMILGG